MHFKQISEFSNVEADTETSKRIRRAQEDFHNSLNDDFNTPLALATINGGLLSFEGYPISKTQARDIASFIEVEFKSLGIKLETEKLPGPIPHDQLPPEVQKLLQERELSRASKQFSQSDDLRKQIEQLGYSIEDTPAGPLVLPK